LKTASEVRFPLLGGSVSESLNLLREIDLNTADLEIPWQGSEASDGQCRRAHREQGRATSATIALDLEHRDGARRERSDAESA
jgi:hypothetical protein